MVNKPLSIFYILSAIVAKRIEDDNSGNEFKTFVGTSNDGWVDENNKEIGNYMNLQKIMKSDLLFPVTVVYKKLQSSNSRKSVRVRRIESESLPNLRKMSELYPLSKKGGGCSASDNKGIIF